MKDSDRIEYIDTAKGIAVLLVIIGHIYSMLPVPMETVITSLHNPTFYVAGGILLAAGRDKLNANPSVVLKKKFARLIIPFGIWSIIYASITYFAWGGFVNRLADAMNKLWFLPVLFIAISVIIIMQNLKINLIFVMLFEMCGMTLGVFVSSVIAKLSTYVLIVCIGYFLIQLDDEAKNRASKISLAVWGILILAYSYVKMAHGEAVADSICLLISLYCSIVGGINLIYLLRKFNDRININARKCLVYVGQNSLYFYILHFSAIYCLDQIMDKNVFTYIFTTAAAITMPVLVQVFVKNTVVERVMF